MQSKSYTSTSLETSACLWEAILDWSSGLGAKGQRAHVERAREEMGTSHLRLTVIGWTDAADEDWAKVKDSFDRPYDWEFIPEWVAANVDWSSGRPVLREKRLIPGIDL